VLAVMRTSVGHMLTDWDTLGLAPRERDLWMLLDHVDASLTPGAHAATFEVDPIGVRYFRLRWLLVDVASYTEQLRSPHIASEDVVVAYQILGHCLRSIRQELLRSDPSERTASGIPIAPD
jgi:spectinomycin phosphotransferase